MKIRFNIVAGILTATLAVSCAEELDNSNGREETIQFAVDDSQEWQQLTVETRSAGGAQAIPLLVNGSASDLKLTATTVSGIFSSTFSNQKEGQTRGEAKKALKNNFRVIAYEYANTKQVGDADVAVTYTDVATTTDNTTWTLGTQRYWPEGGKVVSFLGISPETYSGTWTLPAVGDTGTPAIHFTVQKNVADQVDLMTALSAPSSYGTDHGRLTMPFKHALTAVRFAIGNGFLSNRIIESIELKGIAKSGTVYIEEGGYRWDVGAATEDYYIGDINMESTGALFEDSIKPAGSNGAKEATLLMIPQQLTASQTVVMKLRNKSNNQTETLSATLEGQQWLAGTTVTYLIGTQAAPLEYIIEATSMTAGHEGGKATFTVASYARNTDSGSFAANMPWRIVGYSDDGGKTFHAEKPASCNWVGIVTTSGEGGSPDNPETGEALFSAQKASTSKTMTDDSEDANYAIKVQREYMQSLGKVGYNTNPYDLSTHDYLGNETKRNTANCYVVNRPGYYKLPLVYGNAIENGEVNSVAWTNTPAQAYSGSITSAYIKTNGTPSTDAGGGLLMWQDADGLVSNIRCVAEGSGDATEYYLYFNVDSLTIQPGNAVIAVKNTSGTIMWSWHIWCTPVNLSCPIEMTNFQGIKYYFAPSSLGWCTLKGNLNIYEPRSMLVKVQQASGIVTTFKVEQGGGATFTNVTRGYSTYYQWGRKDPMLPSEGTVQTTNNHEQFYTSDATKWKANSTGTSRITISTSIQHPNLQYCYSSAGNWCNANYTNLWNGNGFTGYTNNPVQKTVYDPCPVGYHVCSAKAMSFMLTIENSSYTTTSKYWNTAGGSFEDGWYFWDKNKSNMLYFPAQSFRIGQDATISSSTGTRIGESGYIWSAMCYETTTSCAARTHKGANNIGSGDSGGDNYHQRYHAFPVYPVMDK